jgi:hypothetical protein
MKTPMLPIAIAACFLVLSSGTVFAASNPSPTGTGRPSQTCQNFVVTPTTLMTPGHAASAQGSVFNEPAPFNTGSTKGGTGGQAYNNAGAPSQYDVACFQQSVKPQLP